MVFSCGLLIITGKSTVPHHFIIAYKLSFLGAVEQLYNRPLTWSSVYLVPQQEQYQYSGIHNIINVAQFYLSFRIADCSENYHGPQCNVFCTSGGPRTVHMEHSVCQ